MSAACVIMQDSIVAVSPGFSENARKAPRRRRGAIDAFRSSMDGHGADVRARCLGMAVHASLIWLPPILRSGGVMTNTQDLAEKKKQLAELFNACATFTIPQPCPICIRTCT